MQRDIVNQATYYKATDSEEADSKATDWQATNIEVFACVTDLCIP